jgi:hypothetical protein
VPSFYNLHNHTPFSDGAYTIDEICEEHLKRKTGVDGVGICDHLFCTPSSREVRTERDFERAFSAEIRAYVAEVRAARDRWAGKMHILCGAEINWPLNKGYLELIRNMLEGVDYVLVEFTDWAGLTQLANQARRWPCPVGLAHTDPGSQYPNTSMDQVVRTLANSRIFYEISAKHVPLEGNPWFNVLPGHKVLVSFGTDTHDDLACLADLPRMRRFAELKGLSEKFLQPARREPVAVTA